MDFENFGMVSYTTQAKVSPFVDYLAKDKFTTTKCKHCSRIFFPPQVDCPYCLTSDIEWMEITSKGELLSFTTAYFGPAGFTSEVPYTLGIVAFPEEIRVLAPISKKIDPKNIKVGMELRVVPIRLSAERVAYHFEC
jgi:hypothetical protein